MTDLAERTRDPTVVDETTRTNIPGDAPPMPPFIGERPDTPASPSSWPPTAKVWVAVLAIAGLILAAVALIGFTTGDDPSATERDLQTQVESVTVERDELVAQVADLQTQIDAITVDSEDLSATLATLSNERDDLVAHISALDNTVTTLTTERDGLVVQIADLETDLALQTQRATAAIAAQEVLASLFPVGVDMTLDIADVVGTYDLGFEQAYCDGFATCGTLPTVEQMTIRETAGHRLELVMPGYPTAGLLRLDGVLYAVLDVATDATACGTSPRAGKVTFTVFARGMTVADDGTQAVTDLAASMTMHAPATPTCAAGTAIYAVQLTP